MTPTLTTNMICQNIADGLNTHPEITATYQKGNVYATIPIHTLRTLKLAGITWDRIDGSWYSIRPYCMDIEAASTIKLSDLRIWYEINYSGKHVNTFQLDKSEYDSIIQIALDLKNQFRITWTLTNPRKRIHPDGTLVAADESPMGHCILVFEDRNGWWVAAGENPNCVSFYENTDTALALADRGDFDLPLQAYGPLSLEEAARMAKAAHPVDPKHILHRMSAWITDHE